MYNVSSLSYAYGSSKYFTFMKEEINIQLPFTNVLSFDTY